MNTHMDLIIRNAGVHDGSGAEPFTADLGILARKIEALDQAWTAMATFLDLLERSGVALNLAQLVGHGTIRIGVPRTDKLHFASVDK
jgi:N-acyl-D-aspartate/D-glutamate deacylase